MRSKYTKVVREAIDKYWGEYHAPPSIRDISVMAIPVRLQSTSLIRKVMHNLVDMQFDGHGRPIPGWVEKAIEDAYKKKTEIPVSG